MPVAKRIPNNAPTVAPVLTPEKTPSSHMTPQPTMKRPRQADEKIVIQRMGNALLRTE
jgi:hypothetical protein